MVLTTSDDHVVVVTDATLIALSLVRQTDISKNLARHQYPEHSRDGRRGIPYTSSVLDNFLHSVDILHRMRTLHLWTAHDIHSSGTISGSCTVSPLIPDVQGPYIQTYHTT